MNECNEWLMNCMSEVVIKRRKMAVEWAIDFNEWMVLEREWMTNRARE